VNGDHVPAWRIVAGLAAVVVLAATAVLLVPVYFRNIQLQNFIRETTPASDQELQQAILSRGRALNLDVAPDHIQIHHSSAGGAVDVRYVIRVTLPLYTVDLHFSSIVGVARR
jgi:hypothetical protein